MTHDDPSQAGGRANNLNVVRLSLAFLVMVSHSFALSGVGKYEPLEMLTKGQESFGSIAVTLFFLISGMLITASWLRSKSMNDFLLRRVLRIYPGFIVALLFSALVTWICCPDFRQHVGHGLSWGRDFLTDAASLGWNSSAWPGTFARNPFPGYANGSLWTIQREFECYLLVAAIGLFCLLKRRWLILGATVMVYLVFGRGLFHVTNSGLLISRFYVYFLVGMVIWLFRDRIRFSPWAALGCVVMLLIAARFVPAFSILFVIAGSYAALCVGLSKPWRFTRWTEKTDISYGVYLYAFPVQQIVAMFPPLRSAALNLLISVPITLGLAFLSWHLIENRFLKMKSARFVDYDPAMPH